MKRGFTLVELLVVLVIVSVVLILVCGGLIGMCGGLMPHYSDGSRTGQIIKVSHKGMFFKSWEIQVKQSDFALHTKHGDTTNLWEASTRDDVLGDKLAKMEGQTVKLTYNQYAVKPMTQDTDYTVNGVEPIPPER